MPCPHHHILATDGRCYPRAFLGLPPEPTPTGGCTVPHGSGMLTQEGCIVTNCDVGYVVSPDRASCVLGGTALDCSVPNGSAIRTDMGCIAAACDAGFEVSADKKSCVPQSAADAAEASSPLLTYGLIGGGLLLGGGIAYLLWRGRSR